MLLSELMAMDPAPPLAFAVEVDVDMLSPPNGLRQVAFLYKGTAQDPADALIDAVISCTLAGIDTIVEIRPEDAVDMMRQVVIAGNAGYHLAVVPPLDRPEDRQDLWEAWTRQCAALASTYFDTPHFAGTLYPISGFFGYLIARAVAGVEGLEPTDPYTRQRFADPIPTAWADAAKAAMHAAWVERLGSAAVLDGVLMRAAAEAVGGAVQLVDRVLSEEDTRAQDMAQQRLESHGETEADPAPAAGSTPQAADQPVPPHTDGAAAATRR